MKKIAILLVFTLGTFIVNAQSVVEGTKFMDNWSVGVNAGGRGCSEQRWRHCTPAWETE